METTPASSTPASPEREELPALPPIADLVSREVRRMGRAWKVESTKSALHITFTLLIVTVIGTRWLLALASLAAAGSWLWAKFTVKATIKPYEISRRKSKRTSDSAATDTGDDYSAWLLGSQAAAEAELTDIRRDE